jgi:hypothetical protein
MVMSAVVGVSLLCAAMAASAAGQGSGKIAPGWYNYPGGIIFFTLEGPNGHLNSPCTIIPLRWAIDTTTADGKIAFTQLMLAFTQDRVVSIEGLDGASCIHGNTEQAVFIHVY